MKLEMRRTIRVGLVIAVFLSGFRLWATDEGVVRIAADQVPIYSAPSPSARVVGRLKKGQRFQLTGESQDGFLRLMSKSGRPLWVQINASHLEFEQEASVDLVEAPHPKPRRWLIDLGASSGSTGAVNYSEVNLGVSYFFYDWLAWRNAFFYRFVSNADDLLGVDSSARLIWRAKLERASGLTLFGGPGARFQNHGPSTPFIEGGFVARLFGFSLGLGAKNLFATWVDKDAPQDDLQYFIILGGSASL